MLKIIIVSLLTSSIIFSQFDSEYNTIPNKYSLMNTLSSDAVIYMNTSLKVLEAPLHFDNSDFKMLGLLSIMAMGSYSVDNKLRTEMLLTQNKSLDNITYYGEKFGRPLYSGIFGALLYSGGLIFEDKYTRETGQMLLEAMACNGIFTQLMKVTFMRARPFTNKGNSSFEMFEMVTESEDNSFPSGHTSHAFTVATVLSERLNNVYASVALYSIASLTAYQRIYSDVHWLSDTLIGAALGTFIGLKVVKLHEKKKSEESGYSLNIFPKITARNYEVGFSLQF